MPSAEYHFAAIEMSLYLVFEVCSRISTLPCRIFSRESLGSCDVAIALKSIHL